MGELEGEAVNVQGRQPKRYTAQHPRSVLGDKRDDFTEKADAATDHLEQQHEIQRERDNHRHPAWVIPGIAGTKRELLDAINEADECVRLLERDGEWIQSNEIRDINHVVDRGVEFKIIGWSRWHSKLNQLVEEAGATAWLHDQVDSSFAIIDGDVLIMRVGRGSTGIKVEDTRSVNILRKAFEAYRQEATEVQSNA
jgi:sugar-specific transcriptional regulator TrmB